MWWHGVWYAETDRPRDDILERETPRNLRFGDVVLGLGVGRAGMPVSQGHRLSVYAGAG